MISTNYVIKAVEGIHARPATTLIRLAKKYKSIVSLQKGDKLVRLNSMLNILALAAKGGETITVIVEGEDEVAAAGELNVFFTSQMS